MKAHEQWWHKNWDARQDDFRRWLRDSEMASRRSVATVVDRVAQDYQQYDPPDADYRTADPVTVLECGCGVFIDVDAFWQVRGYVEYTGLDVTPEVVALGRAKGLTMLEGSIESIPAYDNWFDVVYCRHVLEHLPHYEPALIEMLRVAKEAVVAVFFLLDETADADAIHFNTVAEVPDTYHNVYSKAGISRWLDKGGYAHTWERVGRDWVLSICPDLPM